MKKTNDEFELEGALDWALGEEPTNKKIPQKHIRSSVVLSEEVAKAILAEFPAPTSTSEALSVLVGEALNARGRLVKDVVQHRRQKQYRRRDK